MDKKSQIIGQGNKDPRSEFGNHAIVKYNGKYYDPSYGSPTIAKMTRKIMRWMGLRVYYDIQMQKEILLLIGLVT